MNIASLCLLQEVERIVQRLYSCHTKSSEQMFGLNKEENSEQIYERKVKGLPERALGQVFSRLSLSAPSDNNSGNFIDNPMLNSTSQTPAEKDSATKFVPINRSKDNRGSPLETTTAESSSQNSRSSESNAPSSPSLLDSEQELEVDACDGREAEGAYQAGAGKRGDGANKLRKSSSKPNISAAAKPSSAGNRARHEKPSQEFLSKIQQFSPTPVAGLSQSIEEKIQAAAAAIGSAVVTAPSITTASSRSKATASAAVHIPTLQTVASSHNMHQRALQMAANNQEVDNKWESNASKVMRGQQRKTEQPASTNEAYPENICNVGPAKQ